MNKLGPGGSGPDRVTYPDTYPVAFIGDPDPTA